MSSYTSLFYGDYFSLNSPLGEEGKEPQRGYFSESSHVQMWMQEDMPNFKTGLFAMTLYGNWIASEINVSVNFFIKILQDV